MREGRRERGVEGRVRGGKGGGRERRKGGEGGEEEGGGKTKRRERGMERRGRGGGRGREEKEEGGEEEGGAKEEKEGVLNEQQFRIFVQLTYHDALLKSLCLHWSLLGHKKVSLGQLLLKGLPYLSHLSPQLL